MNIEHIKKDIICFSSKHTRFYPESCRYWQCWSCIGPKLLSSHQTL